MRLIDADALKRSLERLIKAEGEIDYENWDFPNSYKQERINQTEECLCRIDNAPTIDAVEVVRCQDCKYWVYNFNGCSRNPCTEPWCATDFCNYGERKESE